MVVYPDLNDQQLIVLLKQGDELAYREIYERYDKLLFIFAYRKLRDKEEAKDVVQDIFVWLWNNRARMPDEMALSSYLYRSTLNKLFDIFRHQNIIKAWIERGDHYIDIDERATDHLVREKDIQELITREINHMPTRMREIYLLKSQKYFTVKQIAAQLNISEHTVSTQLKRAMKYLRLRLGLVIYLLYILK